MNKEMILGLIRHILTFGGGYLAGNGFLEQGQVDTAIGAVVALVGVAWSAFVKKAPSA